ncbi:2-amino-4-hydroxy-6-hydroxymethyldihydropteridine diphosphokinase [Mycolicibacterium brumae]|uniref:2-amino-4-hydroxy-6-hydroxymethyldihydropteridine diphosphokinase n=1 Tax=Mycolicibacterium brumae TaxID=85968 RepID=A0A2G5P6L0_9MYCO|nr:2-amino-4-hydroxy-6-hydroxymethyldihydropteridine diphosphokinase [Mycolicibacterium brumae]MCV7193784.1 2-amino-4-hydroxy-6-hydroxymethyldihydropteridine diphosphokinase [Mycolicibacterium brumae]PIB74008.1 2-amino-4-hydroxy-6-hydroxymethyldihydropteridine diphosphokinase [Mycolicibacterium brumae]RWA21455.1 hypothetical protein MBRU_14675 [Mycolicibacterium brumae DSM 44177]UWW07335.1 2-amino-4-hydroxy-6-hydroxymethyldihydropteridine diphosphokinase [Mycolicibacterium brumae]
MSIAVLSIGSNVGDRLGHLRSVLDGLGPRVRAVSPVYSTAPWGGVEQDDFLNAVVVAEDDLDPIEWLDLAQSMEKAAHRVRGQHWGPRTLDVDIVTVSDHTGTLRRVCDRLILPHPYAHQRAFVLAPWHDVDPDATLAVDGSDHPIAELLAATPPEELAAVARTDLALR